MFMDKLSFSSFVSSSKTLYISIIWRSNDTDDNMGSILPNVLDWHVNIYLLTRLDVYIGSKIKVGR